MLDFITEEYLPAFDDRHLRVDSLSSLIVKAGSCGYSRTMGAKARIPRIPDTDFNSSPVTAV